MPTNLCPLTVIILTYNEERNLPTSLSSVYGWAEEVFIVDSFSDDDTLSIAKEFGVEVYQNQFEHWATQREWALEVLPITTEWVLFLDADEAVSVELAAEIQEETTSWPDDVAGVFLDRRFYFLGRWLRHGGFAPNHVLRLIRPNRTKLIPAGDREYFHVDGKTQTLKGYLIHEDKRDLAFWIKKHNRISAYAAQFRFDQASYNEFGKNTSSASGSVEGRRRIFIKDRIVARLPFWLQPFLYFFYRYIFKLGFLDGKEGLFFYILHDFWYPWLIEAKIAELEYNQQNSHVNRDTQNEP